MAKINPDVLSAALQEFTEATQRERVLSYDRAIEMMGTILFVGLISAGIIFGPRPNHNHKAQLTSHMNLG